MPKKLSEAGAGSTVASEVCRHDRENFSRMSGIEQQSEMAVMSKALILAVALLAPATRLICGVIPSEVTGKRQSQPVDWKGELLQMNNQRSIHAVEQAGETRKRTHAQSTITVQKSEARPYDQTANPSLLEINLTERFAGDIEGEATVRALQVQRGPRSASLVSMQRFRGKLGGRQGTFVLQGSETVEDGKIKATWFVVPGSGTGDLSGLRGSGGFEGEFGKGSNGTLDYWFE